MNDNFDRAFEYVLRNEGGYSNHAGDSGGATKYGITIGTLGRWRKAAVTVADVGALTRDEAKLIYRAWYWDVVRGDEIPSLIVATVLFDCAVLYGVRMAVMMAQRALWGAGIQGISDDGLVGPRTLKAFAEVDPAAFVKAMQGHLHSRIDYLVTIPKNKAFEKGWRARVERFTALVT